ncbi:phage tail protein [Antarctobacter jejuensis]|uniref:phage tail protein n=1 Tax=Antarctobacter jejuensis TaxID=1439938 RepID=UPI003FD103C1
MNDYYPPAAFSFELRLAGSDAVQASFREVSGLEAQPAVETLTEGGENRFVHKLPGRVKHGNLVCKRGLFGSTKGTLVQWIKTTLEGGLAQPITPKDMKLTLVGADGKNMAAWTIAGAWPVKWEVASFDAATDALAVEALEFAYQTMSRVVETVVPPVQPD